MYQKTQLKNGLRIVINNEKDRDSLSIGIFIGVGGRFETDKNKGAAHFLEHILFKGSKKYNCQQIKESIEGIGGSLNAFTSEEQTCYYAKIPAKHKVATFDVLSDMVLSPIIAGKDVDKERSVILEEIKMYKDLPQYYVMELFDELLWPNHPLGKGLAGSVKSVTAISRNDLKSFHSTFYVPENIVVAASGRMDTDGFVKMVEKKLGAMNKNTIPSYEKFETSQFENKINFKDKDTEQTHLILGTHGFDEFNKDRYILNLLSIILGGNMSSRLFIEVREKKGLAYSISSSSKSLHDTGAFYVRAGIDGKNITDTVSIILKEFDKIKKKEIGRDEFERAREFLLGQMLLILEDTMEHMIWLGESILVRDKTKTLKELISEFNKITVDDVKRVANEVLVLNKMCLAVVGPVKEANKKTLAKTFL